MFIKTTPNLSGSGLSLEFWFSLKWDLGFNILNKAVLIGPVTTLLSNHCLGYTLYRKKKKRINASLFLFIFQFFE